MTEVILYKSKMNYQLKTGKWTAISSIKTWSFLTGISNPTSSRHTWLPPFLQPSSLQPRKGLCRITIGRLLQNYLLFQSLLLRREPPLVTLIKCVSALCCTWENMLCNLAELTLYVKVRAREIRMKECKAATGVDMYRLKSGHSRQRQKKKSTVLIICIINWHNVMEQARSRLSARIQHCAHSSSHSVIPALPG